MAKLYFWAYLVLLALGLIVIVPNFKFSIYDLIGILLSLVGLLPAYSYAYNKNLFPKMYWKIILYFFVIAIGEELVEFLSPNLFASIPYWKSYVFNYGLIGAIMSYLIAAPGIYETYKLINTSKAK